MTKSPKRADGVTTRKFVFAAALHFVTGNALAANYATCILDRVPAVKNNQALQATIRVCLDKHPGGLQAVKVGAGRGVFSAYDSADECLADKAKDTALNAAVNHIRFACHRLYGEPATVFDPSTARPVDWSYDPNWKAPVRQLTVPRQLTPDEFIKAAPESSR